MTVIAFIHKKTATRVDCYKQNHDKEVFFIGNR